MDSPYLWVAQMDISPGKEDLFNEVYDTEHIDYILQAPGFRRATRYDAIDSPDSPKYMVIYEIDSPDALKTETYLTARDLGRWPTEIRPHTSNRLRTLYRRQRTWDG